MARNLKQLDKLLTKKYKEETNLIKTAQEQEEYMVAPTASSGLNFLLGNGGVVLGKVITLTGPQSGGKTALAFVLASAIQNNISYSGKKDEDGDLIQKGNFLLVDGERCFSEKWTQKLGIDTDPSCFRVLHPSTGEIGFESIEEAVRSGFYDVVVIDSLNSLQPTAYLENDIGDSLMGVHARLVGKFLSRIVPLLDQYKVTLIMVSQERNSMDMYAPMVLSGGKSTLFFSNVILRVKRIDWLGKKESPTGIATKIIANKNKLSIPKRTAEIELVFKTGFSFISDYVNSGIFLDVVDQAGAWYTLSNGERFQGKTKVIDYYTTHLKEYQLLVTTVNKMSLKRDFEERGLLTELEEEIISDELLKEETPIDLKN